MTARWVELGPYWECWCRQYKKTLKDGGLPADTAARLAEAVAKTRAQAARVYGRASAERAEFQLEFFADGSMRGRLVGSYWSHEIGSPIRTGGLEPNIYFAAT
jgi:hypothetical protein